MHVYIFPLQQSYIRTSAKRVSSSSFHIASDADSTFFPIQNQSFSTALAHEASESILQKLEDIVFSIMLTVIHSRNGSIG